MSAIKNKPKKNVKSKNKTDIPDAETFIRQRLIDAVNDDLDKMMLQKTEIPVSLS